jgi:ketosteroid isomerase-like protein
VQHVFARLEASDHRGAQDLLHDDFELRWAAVGRPLKVHRGRDALSRHFDDDLGRVWDEVRVTCERVVEDASRVLAFYRVEGSPANGEAATTPHVALIRVHEGLLRRWEAFQDVAHSVDWLAAEAALSTR